MNDSSLSIKIDKIIRSKRKSLSISITKDARIIVRAPLSLSESSIKDIVFKKRDWINKNINRVRELPKRNFQPGERVPFIGIDYILSRASDKKEISISGNLMEVPESFFSNTDSSITEKLLIDWYKKQARTVISARCALLSTKTGVCYSSIRITSAKRRWGSCGSRGSINFSWRLALCPLDVIDYVIIHELVHISVRNHSERFWKRVEEIMPDYRDKEEWLRTKSGHINF